MVTPVCRNRVDREVLHVHLQWNLGATPTKL